MAREDNYNSRWRCICDVRTMNYLQSCKHNHFFVCTVQLFCY